MAVHTSRKRIPTWSYSTLSQWGKCPAKLYFRKIEGLPDPPGPAAARGSRLHKQLERHMLDPELPLLGETLVATEYCAKLREAPDSLLLVEQGWAFDGNHELVKSDATRAPKGGWIAIMDVLLLQPASAHVTDWKSGGVYPDDHDFQSDVYALAVLLGEETMEDVDVTMFYLDQDGHQVTLSYSREEDLEALKEEILPRAEDVLNATKFPETPNRFCGWCPYSKAKGGPCSAA